MSTTFAQPVNNFATTLASGHAAGSGTLALAVSPGTLGAGRIWRVTALSNPGTETETVLGIFEATGSSGANLTGVTAAEGFSNSALPSGTAVEIRITAKGLSEIQAAVNTLEAGGGGGGITALTGDVLATGPGSVNSTLKTVNSNVGTFTLATIAVNAKGLITAASNGTGGGVSLPALGVYNVVDYGADPTGAANSTAAIQAAITACQAASGGTVYLPPGQYKTTATLTISGYRIAIAGAGIKMTEILSTFDGYTFTATPALDPAGDPGSLEFRDMQLDSTVTQTTGGGISMSGGAICFFSDLQIGRWASLTTTAPFYNMFHGITAVNGQHFINRCCIFAKGVAISLSGTTAGHGAAGTISECVLYNAYLPGSIGILFGGGCWGPSVTQTDIGRFEIAIRINTTLSGETNREIFLGPDVFCDDAGHTGLYVDPSSAMLIHWVNVWCAGIGRNEGTPMTLGHPYGNGIAIGQPNAGLKVTLNGGEIYACTGSGIQMSAGRLSVNGLRIHDNGTGTNGGHGIELLGGALMDGVVIAGCSIRNNGQAALGNGIDVVASTTSGVTIVGNHIAANAQGQVAIASGCDNFIVTGNTLAGTALVTNTPGTGTTRHVSNNAGIADPTGGGALANGQAVMTTNYDITASGVYQDTGLSLALPGAGTYNIVYNVRAALGITASPQPGLGYIYVELFNATLGADIANTERLVYLDDICIGTLYQSASAFSHIVTVAGPTTVKLYARREQSGSVTWGYAQISSGTNGRTTMSYVQIA